MQPRACHNACLGKHRTPIPLVAGLVRVDGAHGPGGAIEVEWSTIGRTGCFSRGALAVKGMPEAAAREACGAPQGRVGGHPSAQEGEFGRDRVPTCPSPLLYTIGGGQAQGGGRPHWLLAHRLSPRPLYTGGHWRTNALFLSFCSPRLRAGPWERVCRCPRTASCGARGSHWGGGHRGRAKPCNWCGGTWRHVSICKGALSDWC